jgi:hypothetical protein
MSALRRPRIPVGDAFRTLSVCGLETVRHIPRGHEGGTT